jgi:ABC-type nitrate/sulfonate/bicarbonate transport system substrate-binding protein
MRIVPAAVGVAAALVLSACGGGDGGGTSGPGQIGTRPVRVACAAGMEHLPRQLADSKGFAKEQNVQVECVQVATGPEMSAALLSGALDVALGNAANIAPLLDRGQDLVTFGNVRKETYWDILVRNGYPLPNAGQGWQGAVKDLEGSKFGVVARGAAAETIARAMFAAAGVDANKVTFIATGQANTTIAALQGGTVDAALTFEPGVTLALDQGVATNPFSLQTDTGPQALRHPDMMFFTSRKAATENKDVLCRLQKAWDAGTKYMKDPANRAAVEAEATSFLNLPAATSKKLVDRNVPLFQDSTKLDRAGIDKAFKLLADNGAAAKAHAAAQIAVEVC